MKRYLIKVTSKSTEFNPTFRNETHENYYGVNEEPVFGVDEINFHIINEHGYKTLHGLKRGFNKAIDTYGYFNTSFKGWIYTLSAICVDTENGIITEIKVE